jgi:plasmid stability protein
MASITVRGLDDQVKERIRSRARFNGRSLEAELRQIITRAASADNTAEDIAQTDIGTQIQAIFKGSGEGLELPPRNELQREVIL